jgi:hypothetical protein
MKQKTRHDFEKRVRMWYLGAMLVFDPVVSLLLRWVFHLSYAACNVYGMVIAVALGSIAMTALWIGGRRFLPEQNP